MFENRFLSTWSVIMLDNLHILVLYIVIHSLRSCHNFDKDYKHDSDYLSPVIEIFYSLVS